jgi:phytoene desaturase
VARVVVIGAGLSGLAVATRLARLRHDVVLCERSTGPGGQAGRFERDGFSFDTGPALVTMPAGYRDLFIKTGKTTPLESVLTLEPVDPGVRWRFPDGPTVDLPTASRAGTMDAIAAAFGAGSAEGWDAFLAAGGDIWEAFRKGFVAAPPSRRRDALRTRAGRARLSALCPARSLPDLTHRHLDDPRLISAAHSYALRLGSDPRRSAAAVALWPSMEQTFGTWRVVGGIRRLVHEIAERAASRGVRLRYECPVVAIEREAGAVSGVRLSGGETLPAELVVSAVDHALTRNLLGERPARGPARSASAVTLLLALRGGTGAPPTVSFAPDPDAELAAIFGGLPAPDPTLFLAGADAPAGYSACSVTATAPRHGIGAGALDWDAPGAGEQHAARMIAALDRRGFAISERLLWWEVRTPADVERRSGAPGGALGWAALHGAGGALFRPPNVTGVRGLFQVGSSAHPGPGLAFAPLSAALVAEAVGRAR